MDKLHYSEKTTRAAVKKVCSIPIRSRVGGLHNSPQSSLLLEGLMTYYQYGFEVYLRYSIINYYKESRTTTRARMIITNSSVEGPRTLIFEVVSCGGVPLSCFVAVRFKKICPKMVRLNLKATIVDSASSCLSAFSLSRQFRAPTTTYQNQPSSQGQGLGTIRV